MKRSLSIHVLLKLFSMIPRNVRRSLMTGMSRLFYYLVPRQRLIAIHNLRHSFPEKSDAEILEIARGVYRTMGIVAADFFEIPSLTRSNIKDLVEVEGITHCEKALEKKRGLLLFGAHFGNWELEAIAVSLLLKPLVVIYRPLDNTFLNNLVHHIRTFTGNIPVPKEKAMRQLIRSLRNNEILGILIDQNVAWQEGVFVDFFGRPACTTDGLALLALHTGAPVIPAYMRRLPDGRYRLVFGEELEIIRTGEKSQDVLLNTQNFTRIIEETIRKYPDQWLWIHQRWKTKPWQVVKKSERVARHRASSIANSTGPEPCA